MPTSVGEVGSRHKGVQTGGNVRAAVFGVSDGLVSNASLIMGVAGATQEPKVVLLTGVAGVLAGAFSMAAGEYVSMRSQRGLFEYQDTLAREELGLYPDELGSPWGAAGSSFVAFGVGGAVPLLPFLFGAGTSLLSAIVVVTGIALFGVGAALSLFT